LLLDAGYTERSGKPRPDIGATRVKTSGEHWQPDPEGEWMIVQAVTSPFRWPPPEEFYRVHGGPDVALHDLICWHPARPEQWWFYHGNSTWLGPSPYCGEYHEKFYLYRTPLSWLKAGARRRSGVM